MKREKKKKDEMDEQTTSVLSSTFSFSLSVSMFDCTEKVPGECCSGGDVAFFFFLSIPSSIFTLLSLWVKLISGILRFCSFVGPVGKEMQEKKTLS